MLIIGDVHGKVDRYYKVINGYTGTSIQVGDFGFRDQHKWFLINVDFTKHKINFGNHDDYSFLNAPHSTGDYSYDTANKLMTVRGADSIDKHLRCLGIDWWSNEELSYLEMQDAIDSYIKYKPEIMITHDCPQSTREYLFRIRDKSLTSNGLQAMYEIHQPKLWIFGHHHESKELIINGTKFICLNELQAISI